MSGIVVRYNRGPELLRKFPGLIGNILESAGWQVVNNVRNLMTGPKSGRVYGSHQASAPGEAPAVDTGNLVNSLATKRVNTRTVIVSADAEYALPLEFGTYKMAARPFFQPSADKIKSYLIYQLSRLESRL